MNNGDNFENLGITILIILVLGIIGVFVVDWLVICGLYYLVCLVLGIKYTWLQASIIWAIATLIMGFITAILEKE